MAALLFYLFQVDRQSKMKGMQQISGSSVDVELIIYIGALVIGTPLLIWGIRSLRNYLKIQNTNKAYWNSFYHVCARKKLTNEEQSFLLELAKKYQLKRPERLVRLLATFDKYVYREIQSHREDEIRVRDNFIKFISGIRRKLGFATFTFLEELPSTREISKGHIAELMIVIANMEKKVEVKVHEIDEDCVTLKVPDHFLAEEPVRVNQPVELDITHKNDAQYLFKSVVYKIIQGPPGYICIDHSRTFRRVQKRKHPRHDTEIPFQHFFLERLEEKEFWERRAFAIHREIVPIDGTILNISGGGLFFETSIEPDEGQLLSLTWYLPEPYGTFKAVIGRIERITDLNNNSSFRIYIQFLRIGDKLRNLITQYVYELIAKGREEQMAKLKAKKKKKVASPA